MFALKKLLSAALQPYSLLLVGMAVGLVLLCFTKKQRLGRGLLSAGLVLLALLSVGPVARSVVRPLEAT
jgi:Na+/phosphate symporter